jgi:SAM-dependent methyltransferase
MMVSSDDVRAAYRLILGREPESNEVLAHISRRCKSLSELRNQFLNSSEFRMTTTVPDLAKPLDWLPMPIETDASPAESAQMWSRIERYWREVDIAEPTEAPLQLHLVEDLMSSDFNEVEERFYNSGKTIVQIFQRASERCGISLDDYKVCLELGAGVGRVTVWLSELFTRVLAADISQRRLDLSQRAVRLFRRSNVEHHHVATIDSVVGLPDFDAFFSIMVLQHNPPPVIAILLKTILGKLRPGGIAYFQVPTFTKDYTFTIDDYLKQGPERGMEMHAIPQRPLFAIVEGCGCRLLEIREDPWTNSNVIISNSILVKKGA